MDLDKDNFQIILEKVLQMSNGICSFYDHAKIRDLNTGNEEYVNEELVKLMFPLFEKYTETQLKRKGISVDNEEKIEEVQVFQPHEFMHKVYKDAMSGELYPKELKKEKLNIGTNLAKDSEIPIPEDKEMVKQFVDWKIAFEQEDEMLDKAEKRESILEYKLKKIEHICKCNDELEPGFNLVDCDKYQLAKHRLANKIFDIINMDVPEEELHKEERAKE